MKQCLLGLAAGLLAGMALAHTYEDELDNACYKASRTKKKVMRKFHELSE
ncbi:MAG: hypothetical protein IJ356_05815 [Erysipelotrichaceae bacterium]|nr:hypothetical protein [Erysipelotrichaceae bacterium]